MATINITRNIAAPPETVFEVVTDHRGMADISAIRKSELEREGDPAPNGVGAIRKLKIVGPPIREEVITYEQPRRFAYRLLGGLPLKNHVGTIELEPEGAGTRMEYVVETTPKIPLVGGALIPVIRKSLSDMADAFAKESERRAR